MWWTMIQIILCWKNLNLKNCNNYQLSKTKKMKKTMISWVFYLMSSITRMKRTIMSWVFLLTSSTLLVYDLVSKPSKYQLWNLQILESALILSLLVTSFEDYRKVIKPPFIHLVSFLVSFLLITTIKWELDSTFLSGVHIGCYVYLFIILVIITKKNRI